MQACELQSAIQLACANFMVRHSVNCSMRCVRTLLVIRVLHVIRSPAAVWDRGDCRAEAVRMAAAEVVSMVLLQHRLPNHLKPLLAP